jgi:lipopolysaccharide/colanic/teichoic acid biosynthesis glycosyltransferase
MKRCLDFLLSSIGLVVLSPIVMVIAIMIKKHDGGPVLYTPLRVGLHKKRFRMYKFRTMVQNADTIGGPTTSTSDPRITPVGHFLRRFKLDELPQLILRIYLPLSFGMKVRSLQTLALPIRTKRTNSLFNPGNWSYNGNMR